ncbi:WXG100 family type VII secretion target [Mycobacterium tuberculosis]|nr:WXG100 family type VII secretion target [Mycobacterium tuberculosis]
MGHEAKIRVDTIATDDQGTGGFFNKLKVWEDHFDQVEKVVDSMQPGQLHTAATTYSKAATRINESVGLLFKQAGRLVESWGGDDAEKAMEQMNKAYRQAKEIHDKAYTTSGALTTHANAQTQWKNSYGSGGPLSSWVGSVVKWGAAVSPAAAAGFLAGNNFAAEDVMSEINDGTVQSNHNFPHGIQQDMPKADPNVWEKEPPGNPGKPPTPPHMPGGPGSPGGPPDMPGGPGGPGDLPGGPNGPGNGPGDFPGGPGGPGGGPNGPGGIPGGPGGGPGDFGGGGPGGFGGGPGTDLASMPGGGPGGAPGLGGGGLGGGPGSAPGLGGGGLGGGPGGMGPGMGAGPGAFGPGALGKNALGGKGGMAGMGMPMGGARGGGSGDQNEHERSTWLTEDEDVWGGDDDTAPPVIG